MPIDSNERGAIARSVSKVLVAQSWVSGILAFAIILSAVSIPLYGLYKGDEDIETVL